MNYIFFIAVVAFILFGDFFDKSISFTSIMRSQSVKTSLFILAIFGATVSLIINFRIVFHNHNVPVDHMYFFAGMITIFILSYYAFPELRPKDVWELLERRLNPIIAFRFSFQHSPSWLKVAFIISLLYLFLNLLILINSKGLVNFTIFFSSFGITWFLGFMGMLYPSDKGWKRDF